MAGSGFDHGWLTTDLITDYTDGWQRILTTDYTDG